MVVAESRKLYSYEEIQVGDVLGSYEYVLTQEMLDMFRESVDDPDAPFPTLAIKHDATAFELAYEDHTGTINAANEVEFHAAPVPGKVIKVSGRVADKYLRKDLPYIVLEATAVDEDGRLLEKVRTYQLKKPDELGKKWER